MRRDTFCQLTDETIDALKSKARRGQLPFDAPEGRYARSDYSPWRAIIFVAFKKAAIGNFPPNEVAKIFRTFDADLRQRAKSPIQGESGGQDFFVGIMVLNRFGEEHLKSIHGKLFHIEQQITSWTLRDNVRLGEFGEPVSLSLVNLSKVVRDLRDRASELGIDLNTEYLLDELADGERKTMED